MIFRPSQIEDYETPIQSYKKRTYWGSKKPKKLTITNIGDDDWLTSKKTNPIIPQEVKK